MEVCLFCNEPEKSCKPDADFICGGCFILLSDESQADLKKAYQKALDKGYLRKAIALESFIVPEEKHGRRPIKPVKRDLNRERASRSIRNQKRLSKSVEA